MKTSIALLSGLLGYQVACNPIDNSPEGLEARKLSTCQVVSDVVSILHNPTLSASATKFCSSFISIPLKTSTSVSTTTITPAPVTTTSTITVATSTLVTSTLGIFLTTAPPAVKEKRAGALPLYLKAVASSKVSAAYSCLSIAPATTVTAVVTITETSTSTSTSTVLGAATQCLPAAITNGPVSLIHPGREVIAGTAEQVGSNFPINNLQDCCSACYLATSSCVGFTYGNFDNEQDNFSGNLDNPSNVNTCGIYRDVFGDCANDVGIFASLEGSVSGEVNSFGIGPCTPDTS